MTGELPRLGGPFWDKPVYCWGEWAGDQRTGGDPTGTVLESYRMREELSLSAGQCWSLGTAVQGRVSHWLWGWECCLGDDPLQSGCLSVVGESSAPPFGSGFFFTPLMSCLCSFLETP